MGLYHFKVPALAACVGPLLSARVLPSDIRSKLITRVNIVVKVNIVDKVNIVVRNSSRILHPHHSSACLWAYNITAHSLSSEHPSPRRGCLHNHSSLLPGLN